MSSRKFTREFKMDVCRQIESGARRASQIGQEYGLAAPMVSGWRKEFKARGEEAFTARVHPDPPPSTPELLARIAELERLCGQLMVENVLLKKLSSTPPSKGATT
jgi:transposase-like protein